MTHFQRYQRRKRLNIVCGFFEAVAETALRGMSATGCAAEALEEDLIAARAEIEGIMKEEGLDPCHTMESFLSFLSAFGDDIAAIADEEREHREQEEAES